MVQVQHVSVARPSALKLAGPCSDLDLVLVVVQQREDPVSRPDAVLKGGMHRHGAGHGRNLLGPVAGERRIEADRVHIPVERSGVAVRALIAPGPSHERDRTAMVTQIAGDGTRRVRRSSARREQDG